MPRPVLPPKSPLQVRRLLPTFLMSPASRNWFFATNELPYFFPSWSHWARNLWFTTEATAGLFGLRVTLALLAAIPTIGIGLA